MVVAARRGTSERRAWASVARLEPNEEAVISDRKFLLYLVRSPRCFGSACFHRSLVKTSTFPKFKNEAPLIETRRKRALSRPRAVRTPPALPAVNTGDPHHKFVFKRL